MKTSTAALSVFLFASFSASGCGKGESKQEAPPEPLVAATTDAAPAAPPNADAGIREQMQGHYESIRTIERSVVVGDMETARQQAQLLSEHRGTAKLLADYADELEAVRVAAKALAKEESLPAMAQGAARLASLCGNCHLATTSITSFEWIEAPPDEGSASDRMKRHLWAVDRLWEGLVGPSEMSWQEGSKVLQVNPFPADKLPIPASLEPVAKEQLKAIAELAKRAGAAQGLSERTKVYGDLLSTCSGCHAKMR